MILFGITFAIYEIILWSLLLCVLCGIAYNDRDNLRSSPVMKSITLVAFAGFFMFSLVSRDFTIKEAFSYVISAEGLSIIGTYVVIGLAYSFLEFLMNARRMRGKFSQFWENFVAGEFSFRQVSVDGVNKQNGRIFYIKNLDFINEFTKPVIETNRAALAGWIWTWTVLWPFYAVSLILGDMLKMVFDIIADVFVKFSKYITSYMFKDVFK